MLALRYGSAENCERPIQLFSVVPRSDGRTVMARFSPTSTPSTYNRPVCVVPSEVQPTCLERPQATACRPTRCFASPPPELIEPRNVAEPSRRREKQVLRAGGGNIFAAIAVAKIKDARPRHYCYP